MNKILIGDAIEQLKIMPDESVQCVVTSPPYFGLRDYSHKDQIGLEETPEKYTAKLVSIFREVLRVLRKDGVCWLNLGDSYSNNKVGNTETKKNPKVVTSSFKKPDSGLPHKNLIGIPWRIAFALQADGWYLRQDIIWAKPNPMPESVTDRCTKAHEYIFLLSKSPKYYFNHLAIQEPAKYDGRRDEIMKGSEKYREAKVPGQREHTFASRGHERWQRNEEGLRVRNKRSVWTINTKPYKDAHSAVFPEALVEPCVLAGSKQNDVILDPFAGSGTTLAVAKSLGRKYIGIELNPDYLPLIMDRLKKKQRPML